MNWKTKAAIQRGFARLPFGSETAYYQLQRRFGNLRSPEPPFAMFRHGVEIFAELREAGTAVEGARVLEVGTGHRIHMPLAFYLAGAQSITTVDLYPILKRELVMLALQQILAAREETVSIFRPLLAPEIVESRLNRLVGARSFEELQSVMRLEYRAPCDATATGLAPHSIDLHFSYTVFEHIPGPVLVGILREGSRLISPQGLLCHHIDLSDHYSHGDPTVGKINFLQFSAEEWKRIDNPRFGYQNRLRETDYRRIYAEAGQKVSKWTTIVDRDAVQQLETGFELDPEYQGVSAETLATVSVRALSRPGRDAG